MGLLGWKLSETDILSQCLKGTECAISCNGHVLSHQEDYMDIGHHRWRWSLVKAGGDSKK